ncbi:CcoQ/FixQ family Cbb3-type cytochrome c oxidase assembly chaperone [uncultured Cytophaga sp.]|uniref:CcoQ/FixQ family Cbb3-type cytochrome c oxidase assembly chaperone n=1 Tax=uncultured Cytophaga sp. TaxID=160238 RepID=UPI00260707ED|nr:CcoQ/FixQ family Cbb3-type cytochrome c oxidase assembly chaperone [uncultured Cytophaga sp.]
MSTIGGIEIYPLISFIIFFVFFLIVAILVFKESKENIATMSHLPLEDGTTDSLKN